MPESSSHAALKRLMMTKLKQWYGASIDEYPSSGHELDVVGVTISGVSIYIEVIWSPSRTQVLNDMNMLQESDANVKLVIVNPEILANTQSVRDYAKVVIAQRKQGRAIWGDMLNGQRVAEDGAYVEEDLRSIIDRLIADARSQRGQNAAIELDELKVVKADWHGGTFYNVVGKVVCKGTRVVKRLRATLDFGDVKPQYCSVENSGAITRLDLKNLDYSWSPDGSDKDNRVGEWQEMWQGDWIFVVFPNAVGTGFASIPGPMHWWKNVFSFTSGSHYTIKLSVKGISGSQTISCDRSIDFTAP